MTGRILRRPRLTPDRAALLAVSLAPLLYFYPAALGLYVLCPDDGILFNLPLRVAAAQITAGGHAPLWNPYVFGGMPLLGAMQGGLLLPLNWGFLLLPATLAMNLSVLATYALAGAGAYLYARRAGAEVFGALVTALAWQWGGFMVAQVSHINVVQVACLLPWLLWSIDAYAQTGRRARGALIAVVVALQVFAGHPQTLAYSLLLACACALCMRFGAGARERRAYLSALALVAAGLGLAAVQIVPTLELVRHSVRAEATYDFFSSFSMPTGFLRTFFAPYVLGGGDGQLFRAPYLGVAFYNEYIGYAGLLTLALAGAAAALRWRDARTRFWLCAALVALALALGRYLPFGLYRLVYHVPVINLFRVPARHLMEFDFALAVLAGRGAAALWAVRGRTRAVLTCAVAAACVFLLTWLTVTRWRPEGFRLGREAPVTFLRAPELFMPMFVAALSAWALWRFARGRSWARSALVAVLLFDLALWGHASGWRRTSPGLDHPLWQVPPAVEFLRAREPGGEGSYRILTTAAPFVADAPAGVAASREASGEFILQALPNVYMMHGVENAAGYDGFGLARYSRLAGDMKLWGELADPEETLRGESRAADLLNVRYLVSPVPPGMDERAQLPRATRELGGQLFAEENLGLKDLSGNARAFFTVPGVEATRVALLTALSWSADVPTGAEVGRLRLRAEDGGEFVFPLLAGRDTSEWAHDRDAARGAIKHRRAPVGTSERVEDPQSGPYDSHTYVTSFELPRRAKVMSVEIEATPSARSPKLGLAVHRVSLIDEAAPSGSSDGEKTAVALSPSWLMQMTGGDDARPEAQGVARWRRVALAGEVAIYENSRALPRAWLAPRTLALADEDALRVIRTGKLGDGSAWDPRRAALVGEQATVLPPGDEAEGRAEVVRHEPNLIEVRTDAATPSVLVLSENFYPGWRASVDGRAAETLRVNYNQRGVALPPGAHTVRLAYRPGSVLAGLVVSLLSLAGLLAWAVRPPWSSGKSLPTNFLPQTNRRL